MVANSFVLLFRSQKMSLNIVDNLAELEELKITELVTTAQSKK
jgi:hypothetical protein